MYTPSLPKGTEPSNLVDSYASGFRGFAAMQLSNVVFKPSLNDPGTAHSHLDTSCPSSYRFLGRPSSAGTDAVALVLCIFHGQKKETFPVFLTHQGMVYPRQRRRQFTVTLKKGRVCHFPQPGHCTCQLTLFVSPSINHSSISVHSHQNILLTVELV